MRLRMRHTSRITATAVVLMCALVCVATKAVHASEQPLTFEELDRIDAQKSSKRQNTKGPKRESQRDRTVASDSEPKGGGFDLSPVLELMKAKKFTETIQVLGPVSDRLDKKGLILLSRAHAGKGDNPSRVRTLELALAKTANDGDVLRELGDAFLQMRRFDEAIERYREATEKNSGDLASFEGMGIAYERSNNTQDARAVFEDLLERGGPRPFYLAALCRIYSEDGFLSRAVELCEKAIERNPQDPVNYVHLARAHQDLDEKEKSERVLNRAADRFPASEPILTMAGRAQLAKKDVVTARKHFARAIEIDPKSAQAHLGMAETALELQRYEDSIRSFMRACRLDRKLHVDMRRAAFKVRDRGETKWYAKFQDALSDCN